MKALHIRFGLDLALSVVAGYAVGSVTLAIVLTSYAVTLFAFNVRVNKAMTAAEDYRMAISRMEHRQGEALNESTAIAADAHDRWSKMMDQAEKQLSGPDDDLFDQLSEEDDDDK